MSETMRTGNGRIESAIDYCVGLVVGVIVCQGHFSWSAVLDGAGVFVVMLAAHGVALLGKRGYHARRRT